MNDDSIEFTEWFSGSQQPVRPGFYQAVLDEQLSSRALEWTHGNFWFCSVAKAKPAVLRWRGLSVRGAAAAYANALQECRRELAWAELSFKEAEDDQRMHKRRADAAENRIQQLQEGALKAIELMGRLYGSTSDSMRADLLHRAVDDIKRALFPPIE